mmetsp:Transcript_26992/g.76584  ORF Transcript_26992/g.76584 Transcript_26992/m.76584 type:complete len:225 (-) Transcript_26992:6-680(-)
MCPGSAASATTTTEGGRWTRAGPSRSGTPSCTASGSCLRATTTEKCSTRTSSWSTSSSIPTFSTPRILIFRITTSAPCNTIRQARSAPATTGCRMCGRARAGSGAPTSGSRSGWRPNSRAPAPSGRSSLPTSRAATTAAGTEACTRSTGWTSSSPGTATSRSCGGRAAPRGTSRSSCGPAIWATCLASSPAAAEASPPSGSATPTTVGTCSSTASSTSPCPRTG